MNSRSIKKPAGSAGEQRGWDFLTFHAHVLLVIAADSGIRLRDIATAVGITERGAHKIVTELVEEGYIIRQREGRRNRYEIRSQLPLRHPLVQERAVGDLLALLHTSEANPA